MNNQYIEKVMVKATFVAHTQTCFHNIELHQCYSIPDKSERTRAIKESVISFLQENKTFLLPLRITILRGDSMAVVNRSGRASRPLDAQLKGKFTMNEESLYKQYKPYEVQTGLWKVNGYQSFFAGSIGITGDNGKIDRDNSDLVVVHTTDWQIIDVYVFRGLAGTQKKLDFLPDVMGYLSKMY